MTRIIKASEVTPGMKIEWSQLGIKYTCVVSSIEPSGGQIDQEIMASGGGDVTLYNETPVTVLAEAQPEVPERLEEWPENDVALRAHRWKDRYKNVLDWNKTQWRKTIPSGYAFAADDSAKFDGPWTRETDV